MNSTLPPLDPAVGAGVWIDTAGASWSVLIDTTRLLLSSPSGAIEVPSTEWPRDLLVSPLGEGFVLRVETYAQSATFVLTRQQIEPLRACAERLAQGSGPDAAAQSPEAAELLWPRVSALAVWALLCSAFAFLPLVGIVPALITVILLITHRFRVRRSAAYRHSRIMCTVAAIITASGLCVSAATSIVLVSNLGRMSTDDGPVFESGPSDEGRLSDRDAALGPQLAALLGEWTVPWERDINWPIVILGVAVIIASLSVHECAHAITAWWLGDDFARRDGRVTLNPLSHIDPFGTVLLPFIFFFADVPGFGYARPVPVRLDYVPRPRRASILVSLAGPGSNIVLAALSLMLLLALGAGVTLAAPGARIDGFASVHFDQAVSAAGVPLAVLIGPLCALLKLMFLSNVILAFFNMIPVPPLDGSWVLQHLFPRTIGRLVVWARPYGWIVFLLLIYSGSLQYFMIVPLYTALLPGFLLLELCTKF